MKRLDSNLYTLLYLIYIFCRIEKHSMDSHKYATAIYRYVLLPVIILEYVFFQNFESVVRPILIFRLIEFLWSLFIMMFKKCI